MREITQGCATAKVGYALGLPENMREGIREVIDVYVPREHRCKGEATKLVDKICKIADANGRVLILQPRPFDDSDMDQNQLIHWYTRFGFEIIQCDPILMARQARQ